MVDFDPVSYIMGAKAGSGAGGGGSTTLSGLTDVDISNPADGQTLVYNATTGKWENGAGGGGVLNIGYDADTYALDKTYNEIKNAFLVGKKCIIIEEGGESGPEYIHIGTSYVDIVAVSEVESSEPGQTSMVCIITDCDGSRYRADSADGYPVADK